MKSYCIVPIQTDPEYVAGNGVVIRTNLQHLPYYWASDDKVNWRARKQGELTPERYISFPVSATNEELCKRCHEVGETVRFDEEGEAE